MFTITKKQLGKEYLELEKQIKGKKFKLSEWLLSLSDRELFVFVAADTVLYGRSFEASVKNANFRMRDREDIIKSYKGRKLGEYDGTIVL